MNKAIKTIVPVLVLFFNIQSLTAAGVDMNNNLTAFADVIDDVSCSGTETAEVLINVAGGSGDYLVMISTNPSVNEVQTGVFQTFLPGGSYSMTITDNADNCMLVDNFAVGQPSPIVIEAEITDFDECSGMILMVDITSISGGTPPYSTEVIQESNGVDIVVTDDEGCMASLFLDNPEIEDALMISNIIVTDTESGDDDGAIDITVSGGAPPYAFLWRDENGNDISTDEDIEDLEVGVYTVFISDSDACSIGGIDIEVDALTASNEITESSYTVYPNPAVSDIIFIEGSFDSGSAYQIITSDGQLIEQSTIQSMTSKLRLNLPHDGLYIIRISGVDNKSEVHRVIKM